MGGEAAAEKKLYDAASKGDISTLELLLIEDPNLVERVSFACSNRTPLHIATLHGHVEIVKEMVKINSKLARLSDAQKSSPLHRAAEEGHVQIASILFSVAPEMYWRRNDQGMNPVHIAAMNGDVRMLKMMLDWSHFPAMERVHRGQTVLHLCVKHDRRPALMALVEKLGELVCAKDDDGETLLHLAIRCNQLETLRYLVEENKIKKDTPNSMGKTAMDILNERHSSNSSNYSEMKRILMTLSKRPKLKALPNLSDTMMVVVVLIATMAFQAALTPPGGVWQDDTSSHRAGDAVMASTHPKMYKHFVRANTTAFISSLVTIFLVTTRQPSGRIFFLLIAVYATWVSLASIAVSYGASIMVITPHTETQSLVPIIVALVAVFLSLMGFVFVSSWIRRLYLSWKSKIREQQDLTNDSLIRRTFYLIFRLLDPAEDYELVDVLGLVLRTSAPASTLAEA